MREQFWGDLAQHTRQNWQDLLGLLFVKARDRYLRCGSLNGGRIGPMPGTCLGTLRVRVARTRQWALWRKLRPTNAIERCFVEVRGRTRSMRCCVNVQRVERIMFSIFNRFKSDASAPFANLHKCVTSPLEIGVDLLAI